MEGDSETGFCLAAAFSCPAHRKTAPLLAHCLAIRPLPPAHTLGDGATPPETRQNLPVDALGPVSQDGAAMNESQKQFLIR